VRLADEREIYNRLDYIDGHLIVLLCVCVCVCVLLVHVFMFGEYIFPCAYVWRDAESLDV